MNKLDILNEEEAVKYLEERCSKTFVGLYTGKNVQVIIDPSVETAYYNALELEIRIGTKIFKDLVHTNFDRLDELDLDTDARTVLFHEVGHGIWTPQLTFNIQDQCLPKDEKLRYDIKMTPAEAWNLFEDERMEHSMRKFLPIRGINFKQLMYDIYRLKEGEYKETDCFNSYCFNLIRLHLVMFPQDYELLDKLRTIINKYERVNNIVQDFCATEDASEYADWRATQLAENVLQQRVDIEIAAQGLHLSTNRLMAVLYATEIGQWYKEAYKSWQDNQIGVRVRDDIITKNLEVAWMYDVKKNPNNYSKEKLDVIKLIQKAQTDKTTFKKLKMRLASEFLNRHKNKTLDENKKKVEELGKKVVEDFNKIMES